MRLRWLETIGLKEPCGICIVQATCENAPRHKKDLPVTEACPQIIDYWAIIIKRRRYVRRIFKKYLKHDWCEECCCWRPIKTIWKNNLGCDECHGGD